MKIKHLMIAGCLFTAFTLQSCIKEKDLYQAPPTTYSELNLQLDGDYLSTELPMARATTPTKINESETLVGIAITMTPKEGQNPSSKPYAYGIFQLDKAKDPNNLKIKVIDGYTYRISCSMIANAKDSIIKDEKGFFGAPFDLERSGTIKGECLNKFLTAEQVGGAKFHVCNGLYCRTTYVRTIFKAVRMYNNAGIFRSALLRSEKPESCRNYYSSFPHSVFALMYHRSWNFNAGTDRAFL